jgi:hypothetical protein
MSKRNKLCQCQLGGNLTPAQIKKLMNPVRTMPHPIYQYGGCQQHGGNIFSSIAHGFKQTFSNPLRAIAAVGSGGMSEAFIRGGQGFKKVTGLAPSKALGYVAPVVGMVAPELAVPLAVGKAGYGMIGLGKKRKRVKRKVHKPRKVRKPKTIRRKRKAKKR